MENPKKGHFKDHLRERTIILSIKVYRAKICQVVEECDEKMFWIEYSVRTGFHTREETDTIQKENEVLLRIITTT